MTDKAYIVANKQQELEVLKKLERKGVFWLSGRNATDFVPSENFASFTYPIIEKEFIVWSTIEQLEDETIVYDGRKEENMYKVTQEFMNMLNEWRDINDIDALQGHRHNTFRPADFKCFPDVVSRWFLEDENPIERNNRLIAIIQWLNGEDVFEVEEPHKFVVRNDTPDGYGDYYYVQRYDGITYTSLTLDAATAFDTREEAKEWANSHQVVVEIDEEENEVE